MKKIIFLIVASIVCSISLTQPIHAKEQNTLSVENYVSAITEEAKKYNVDVWINDYEALGEITQDKIDQAVKNVQLFATTIHTEENNTNLHSSISTYASTKTRTGYFDIVAAPGSATINVDITASVSSGNKISSISRKNAYQAGVAFFFSSWTTHSISTTMNSPSNGYVKAVVTGYAVFNYGVTSYASNMTGSCLIDFR